ncbi:response regulator [Aurantiacibacter sp. MUD11]|uniref:response regulator transcription factor n=1 Tax=Aurantiacibacter sp. MUD11 TaxID=3003265 RepID=UPI0022AAE5BD|nr:response regulator [Aurantiacibacter sp. MUD11]WAT18599.1 response regulator [Aurantiacibacter sp. MUD11]
MAHILVVDDDDILAANAARILIGAGHVCGWVCDAKEAVATITKSRPDLVLLDQNMPGENGSTLLRRLRNSPRYYDLPIAMLTGVTGLKEEQVAYYNGAQDYIRKPFSEKMLVFRVNQVLKTQEGRPRHQPLEDLERRRTAQAKSSPRRFGLRLV